ncbi:phage gp45-like [Sphingomonas vulcanisoli]|uniref:Phage gp45-like n=1 Tax=Sphingomonas vulcanisoli TaxID=1658060 RepID=A0ABX0TSN5_9SPHN|nr:phage baseplate assembly protein [Sphingomonas vulcanisoli]NIJ07245.1 phage gp45-like [Sphingomonas vulcanisoli]
MIDRLLTLLRVGRLKLVDDDGVIQRMQAFEGDLGAFGGQRIIDKVPYIGQFGLLSVPPLEAELLLAAPAGDRTQTIAIGSNHQPSRPTGNKPGDSGLYDVRRQLLTLAEDGTTIDAAGLQVTIRNASKVRIECDLLEITGDLVSRADGVRVSLNGLRDAYDVHKHPGVAGGGSSTGTTDHSV